MEGGGRRGDRGARSSAGRVRGQAALSERDSYYGRPILKEPVWTWEIPTYFFTGGLAGASATLGWAAQATGNEPLARSAWSAALAGVAVSPALLISDLGRPKRFLNMLRLFKLTSPMNVGAWILTGSGGAFTAAFVRARLRRLPRLGRACGVAGGAVLGPALCTYTAVLVADTAIPAWHEARQQLPFVFAGGSIGAAGAAACILTPAGHATPARRVAITGAALELLAAQAMERHLGELGKPYHEGRSGRFARAAKSLSVAGAAVIAARGSGRGGAAAGGALVLAGSLCERFAIYHAGFESARDPQATVAPQRARAGDYN